MAAGIILLLAAVFYRLALALSGSAFTGTWANFTPLVAIAFCGAMLFRGPARWLVPLGALFFSDILLYFVYPMSADIVTMLVRYLALGGIVLAAGHFGSLKATPQGWFRSLAGVTLCSLGFYLITNSFSWLLEPAYAKSLAGWVQAITVGVPGYVPSWMFFRNALVGDLFFTALFLATLQLTNRQNSSAALQDVQKIIPSHKPLS